MYYGILSFVLGTILGSFCNAWAWRIVNHEDITKGRSHCTNCGHVLGPFDLIPIFSYVYLKGKCRYCGSKFSPRYLLTELLSGSYYLSIFLVYGFSMTTVRLMLLGSILLTAALVDIDIMELPDGLLGAAAILSLLRFFDGTAVFSLSGILNFLSGLLPAVFLLMVVLLMNRIMKRETMGGGDIKLLAVLGLHYGPAGAGLILILACIIGLLFAMISKKGKSVPFPFGPSLVLASWIMAIAGERILTMYFSLFL